jgi:LytS/YehU family sensor histidine kinase
MALAYYRQFLDGQMELANVGKRLLESHLNTLRMQLEPHFLFNALNAISSEIVSNPELARNMIEDLGALLRLSLDYKNDVEIPLAQELVLLEHYLAIQRVRFEDRIRTEVKVDTDVTTALVPCMLLQPIVENAIRHGLGRRISGGTVNITASRVGDYVEIRVADDGVGLPEGWTIANATGLGLRVTQERLAGLYPYLAESFDIRRRAPHGTEVIMRVPLRAGGAGEHGPA